MSLTHIYKHQENFLEPCYIQVMYKSSHEFSKTFHNTDITLMSPSFSKILYTSPLIGIHRWFQVVLKASYSYKSSIEESFKVVTISCLGPPTSLTRGIKKPFSEVALQTRESRPYFPLPLSILAGTYLIMLFIFIYFSFFCNPIWFPRKSIPHLISRKIASFFFFAPCVF